MSDAVGKARVRNCFTRWITMETSPFIVLLKMMWHRFLKAVSRLLWRTLKNCSLVEERGIFDVQPELFWLEAHISHMVISIFPMFGNYCHPPKFVQMLLLHFAWQLLFWQCFRVHSPSPASVCWVIIHAWWLTNINFSLLFWTTNCLSDTSIPSEAPIIYCQFLQNVRVKIILLPLHFPVDFPFCQDPGWGMWFTIFVACGVFIYSIMQQHNNKMCIT